MYCRREALSFLQPTPALTTKTRVAFRIRERANRRSSIEDQQTTSERHSKLLERWRVSELFGVRANICFVEWSRLRERERARSSLIKYIVKCVICSSSFVEYIGEQRNTHACTHPHLVGRRAGLIHDHVQGGRDPVDQCSWYICWSFWRIIRLCSAYHVRFAISMMIINDDQQRITIERAEASSDKRVKRFVYNPLLLHLTHSLLHPLQSFDHLENTRVALSSYFVHSHTHTSLSLEKKISEFSSSSFFETLVDSWLATPNKNQKNTVTLTDYITVSVYVVARQKLCFLLCTARYSHTHTDNHASLLAWFWRGVLERFPASLGSLVLSSFAFLFVLNFLLACANDPIFLRFLCYVGLEWRKKNSSPQRRSNSFLFAVLLRDQLERDQRVSLDWLIVWWFCSWNLGGLLYFLYLFFFWFDILSSLFELNFNYFRILNFRLRVNHWNFGKLLLFSVNFNCTKLRKLEF